MALCPKFLVIILLLYLTIVGAAFSLSSGVAKFIPKCAQQCFESFLDANYDESKGGSIPSLQFLCSTKSTGGNTVGEGAVFCIMSEQDAKFCTGSDAKATVVEVALEMCNGIPNAIPNTHDTITAPLVRGTSGVVLIAPAKTSGSVTHSNISSTTATSRATSTINPEATATLRATSATNSRTGSLSQTTATATSNAATLPPTQKSSEEAKLSKNQIVGISVAGVGGAAIAIGAMVSLICLRKRKLSRRGSDTLLFQTDPEGPQQTLGSWRSSPTPPRVPPRFDVSPPNMFSRRSIIPDIIGLAISPDQQDPVRRFSKLLPEKPTVTSTVPNETSQIQTSRRLIPSMQSTMTQFEEDDPPQNAQTNRDIGGPERSISTTMDAFLPSLENTTNGQFPPRFAQRDSENGIPQYKSQNTDSISRALAPEPDLYVKPLRLSRQKLGSFSRPLPKSQEPRQHGGLEAPNTYRPLTHPPSLYSQQALHNGVAPFFKGPSTRQLSLNIPGANAQSFATRPTSYQQVGAHDRGSSSSLTSFKSENVFQGNKELRSSRTSVGLRRSVVELSPVAGSPSSEKTYISSPKMPAPVRLATQTIKMVPPPPQPDFGLVFTSHPNQNANLATKPWRAAEIAAQQQRNMRRDELRLSRATRPSPQLPNPILLPAAQIRERWEAQPVAGPIMNQMQNNNTTPLFTIPSQPQPAQLQVQTRSHPQPLPQYEAPNMPPGAFIPRHSRSNSTNSSDSTSSSLLAKRVGANKAAALHLIPKADPRDKTRPGWRVLKPDEIQAAKDPGWRPQLVQQVQSWKPTYEPESGGTLSSRKSVRFDMEQNGGHITPPLVTPGWVPKLTPTRKGDELFLSVQ